MRSIIAALTVGLGSTAFAQQNVPAMQSLPGGTPIGSSYGVKPVGTQLPQVGTRLPQMGRPPAGATNPSIGNFNPQQNTNPDPNNVIAPYPTSGKPEDKGFWDKLYDRWTGLFTTSAPPQVKTYTPGIARRARERDEKRFARD